MERFVVRLRCRCGHEDVLTVAEEDIEEIITRWLERHRRWRCQPAVTVWPDRRQAGPSWVERVLTRLGRELGYD